MGEYFISLYQFIETDPFINAILYCIIVILIIIFILKSIYIDFYTPPTAVKAAVLIKNKFNPKGIEDEKISHPKKLYKAYRFSHHPLCKEFSMDHVFHVRGHKVCRGCVLMYLGFFSGLVIFPLLILLQYNSPYLHFAIGVSFFLVILGTSFFKPHDFIRHLRRLFTGWAYIEFIIILVLTIFQLLWWLTIITILVYVIGGGFIKKKRFQSNQNVCRNCSELKEIPCLGLKNYYNERI